MSVFTTVSRIFYIRTNEIKKCPSCGNNLVIKKLVNKRNVEKGFTATCNSGCIDKEENNQILVFYAWNLSDLFIKIDKFK